MIRQSMPSGLTPGCEQFGDKIMRSLNIWERDQAQNRIPLLLIALSRDSKPAFYPMLGSTIGGAFTFNEFQRAW